MWEYVLGGVIVFVLIVTLGAWINGRMIRKVLMKYFKRMGKRFEELIKQHNEILKRLSSHHDYCTIT